MEALILEYENKQDLNNALDVLNRSGLKGISTSILTSHELQLIGKKKLVQLKEKIDCQIQDDENDINEEEIKTIVDEVRQKMYEEGLHSRH